MDENISKFIWFRMLMLVLLLSAVICLCLWPFCVADIKLTLTLFQPSMDSICPIGLQCATEISALLSPPSPLQVQVIFSFILCTFLNPFHFTLLLILLTLQKYYHDLLTARGCSGIKVKQDGNFGKGFIYLFLIILSFCLCSASQWFKVLHVFLLFLH